jgi:hypothetical protein
MKVRINTMNDNNGTLQKKGKVLSNLLLTQYKKGLEMMDPTLLDDDDTNIGTNINQQVVNPNSTVKMGKNQELSYFYQSNLLSVQILK